MMRAAFVRLGGSAGRQGAFGPGKAMHGRALDQSRLRGKRGPVSKMKTKTREKKYKEAVVSSSTWDSLSHHNSIGHHQLDS